jgi:hypothetical protein
MIIEFAVMNQLFKINKSDPYFNFSVVLRLSFGPYHTFKTFRKKFYILISSTIIFGMPYRVSSIV